MNDPKAETDRIPANNRIALRHVARTCRKVALSTSMALEDGTVCAPYVSLATVALDHDLSPILLLSGLAEHTRNLMADPRVALLFDGTEGHANPQTGPRVTLLGRAERTADPRLSARFLARHPAAGQYAGFGDFGFWRIIPERAHFVGGFARAVWFDAPFGLEASACAALAEDEEALVRRLNRDNAAILDQIAQTAGAAGQGWRLSGLDPDGADLVHNDTFLRVAFAFPVENGAAAQAALHDLAHSREI